jgi:hypothetical protein
VKRSVLITGARAPVALHWARLFSAAGWRVVVADSLKAPLARFSQLVDCFEHLPLPKTQPIAFAHRIAKVVEFHQISLILPTCEEVFHLAAAAQGQAWSEKLYAPPLKDLLTLHDKGRFNALVAQVAPDFAPVFHRLESRAALEAVEGEDWVFKPCFTRFGTDILIRPDAALRATVDPTVDAPWIAQSYLRGEELCCSALVREGRVLALQAYRPVVRLRNGTGAGIVFEAADDARQWAIEPLVRQVAEARGLTGQLSFDFRQDAAGQYRVLECNPRGTSGFHFYGPRGGLVEAVVEGRETLFKASSGVLMGERLPTVLVGGARALGKAWRLRSLSHWPNDPLSPLDQARSFAELLRIASRNKCSIEAASTLDISWNIQQNG